MMTEKRGRGRPKGSRNKKTMEKLLTQKVDPETIVGGSISDMSIPEGTEDIVDQLMREHGGKKYGTAKGAPSVPRMGKYFVMKIREPNGRSRIIISHMDFHDSFPLATRRVITKFGIANGLSCPIVMRFLDVVTDPETEEPMGVYQLMTSPSVVRTAIDPRKLATVLTGEEIDDAMDEHMRHKALSYKMQRDLWRKEAETYKAQYSDLSERGLEMSEELTATALEQLVQGIMSSKEIFDDIRKKQMPWYERYQNELLGVAGIGALIWLFTSGVLG
jgi:hypothetical protein